MRRPLGAHPVETGLGSAAGGVAADALIGTVDPLFRLRCSAHNAEIGNTLGNKHEN